MGVSGLYSHPGLWSNSNTANSKLTWYTQRQRRSCPNKTSTLSRIPEWGLYQEESLIHKFQTNGNNTYKYTGVQLVWKHAFKADFLLSSRCHVSRKWICILRPFGALTELNHISCWALLQCSSYWSHLKCWHSSRTKFGDTRWRWKAELELYCDAARLWTALSALCVPSLTSTG